MLAQLTLTVFTGLTLEHSRILLGYCLSYGENHDDTRFFLQFLLANGGAAINAEKNVIMSDRGACAGPVDEVFPLAIHHYCPKHLERNLQAAKYEKAIIEKFWEARGAKNKIKYEVFMKEMESISTKGAEAAVYLRAIPKWQLHVILAKHAVLYELQSDNLVEGMFATLKEARCHGSALHTTMSIASSVLETLHTAEKKVPHTGYLTLRAYQASLASYEVSHKQYKARSTSSTQYTVTYLATTDKGKIYDVNLRDKYCSCEHWAQSGYPCAHAWAAISTIPPTGKYLIHP